jgi:hypothetical protein
LPGVALKVQNRLPGEVTQEPDLGLTELLATLSEECGLVALMAVVCFRGLIPGEAVLLV